MKSINIKAFIFLSAILLASCSQSLEDTYGEYAGDGKIRYLSKCSDLIVKPGWQRIELKWKNGVDATISNVKVLWTVDEITSDTTLSKDATSVNIPNLKDGTYKFQVFAINTKGDKSLAEIGYGRPYTEVHEEIRTFTPAVIRHFMLKDRLVCIMDRWSNNISEIKMNYTDMSGNEIQIPMTKEVFDKNINVFSDVDITKPITILRKGRLENCDDEIVFSPLTLGNDMALTSNFKAAILARYGYSDNSQENKAKLEDFLRNATELEIDYDMESFEDILYCQNLKKLILGKNRYVHQTYSLPQSKSTLFEKERSLIILDEVAKADVLDLKIDRYNDNYFSDAKPYITDKGIPTLPSLTCVPASDIETFTNSVDDPSGYNSGFKNLFDNDPKSYWEPIQDGRPRQYEIKVDLKKVYSVKGFKVAQRLFDPGLDTKSHRYLPYYIEIEVSADKISWQKVTFVQENTLGRGPGEVTLLKMPTPQDVKYIKFILNDQSVLSNYGIMVADVVPFY